MFDLLFDYSLLKIAAMSIFKVKEIVYSTDSHVQCSGGDEINDHPLIYLQINPETKQIICPYCSKTFKLKSL